MTDRAELALQLTDAIAAAYAATLRAGDRAFRTWEGTTPVHWRTSLTGRDDARQVSRTSKLQ